MFKIYQENGDVVACIGSALSADNMRIFKQANASFGMMITPNYKCFRCNGTVSQIYSDEKMQYQPSLHERIAAMINSLPCNHVFAPNTNTLCFFAIFREARRLRESVEQAALLTFFCYFLLLLVHFID